MVENKSEEYSQQDLQDMLKIYYKRLFPLKNFYRWLTYSHSKLSFCFNLIVINTDYFYAICIKNHLLNVVIQ